MSKKLISILLTVAIILGILPPIQAQAYMKEEKPDFILGEFDSLKTCLTYITGDPNGEYHRDIGTGVLDRWEEITSQAVEEF